MPIRETFWNIPHWAEIAQYIFALLTAIVFIYGVRRRILRVRQGRPEKRGGHFWARLWSLVVQVLGHKRTLGELYPGLMHCAIFWGMLVLAVNTDPLAPIFNVAKYGVEMDIFDLVEVLTEQLKAVKV